MNLLIDLDGVVCRWDFPRLTKEFFGVSVPNELVYTYSLEDALGVPTREVHEMFCAIADEPPEFIKGAIESLTRLQEARHSIVIYSNRRCFIKNGCKGLQEWLCAYGIPNDRVLPDLEGIPTGFFDFQIDDHPYKLLSGNGTSRVKLLFDQPWNRQCLDIHQQFIRVKAWKEIEELVMEENQI